MRGLLGGNILGVVLKVSKARHLDIIKERKHELFSTLRDLRPDAPVQSDTDTLVNFLSTADGSIYQEASKIAHEAKVCTVWDAASARDCTAALDWLRLLTNGDISGHKETKICTLIQKLKGEPNKGPGIIKAIEGTVSKETEEIVARHHNGRQKCEDASCSSCPSLYNITNIFK